MFDTSILLAGQCQSKTSKFSDDTIPHEALSTYCLMSIPDNCRQNIQNFLWTNFLNIWCSILNCWVRGILIWDFHVEPTGHWRLLFNWLIPYSIHEYYGPTGMNVNHRNQTCIRLIVTPETNNWWKAQQDWIGQHWCVTVPSSRVQCRNDTFTYTRKKTIWQLQIYFCPYHTAKNHLSKKLLRKSFLICD